MMIRFIAILVGMVSTSLAHGQTSGSADELMSIIDRAEKANAFYTETFKNLSTEETKIFDKYDNEENLKETRRIRLIFIVYQSPKTGTTGELRNVVEYNGKSVARQNREIEEFFEKLSRLDSVTDEIKRIQKEGNRFDGGASAWGMTLWQESPFGSLKPFVEYKIVGREKIEGRDTIVIEYLQTKPTLLVKFNPTAEDWRKEPDGRQYAAVVSSGLRPYNPFIKGKIWLDATTFETWLNEYKVMLMPPGSKVPIEALDMSYQYQSNGFKFLLPKRFTIKINKLSGSVAAPVVKRDRVMTFEYSKFSEFDSQAKDYKINDQH